jgi:hypothetical protein
MKRRLSNQRTGLTFEEVLVSISVVALFAVMAFSIFAKSRVRASRINCVSNLKQIGLAFRMWSGDQGGGFPWAVSITNGGTLEFAGKPEVFRHYLAISNEMSSPKVLTCEQDEQRTKASSWDQVTSDSRHISYFLGLTADQSRPQMILTGDRNLTTNGRLALGLIGVTSNTVLGLAPILHKNSINVGLADGSAQQMPESMLQRLNGAQLASSSNQSVLLAIP